MPKILGGWKDIRGLFTKSKTRFYWADKKDQQARTVKGSREFGRDRVL